MIEAGDGADVRSIELRRKAPEIVRRRHDVAVDENDAAVLDGRRHVDQVRYLLIGAVRRGGDDETHIATRKFRLKALHDIDRLVVGRLDAENDLDRRGIVLRAERGEVLEQRGLVAPQRLENGYRRLSNGLRRGLGGEPHGDHAA